MKKLKIISILLLVVIMSTFVLVGCSTKTNKITIADDIINGTITVDNTTPESGDLITITVTPADNYRIALGGITYTAEKYGVNYPVGNTFKAFDQDTVVSATFEKIPEIEAGDDYARVNAKGEPDAEGEIIYFGEYPQSIMAESVTINSAPADTDGYYKGSDGNRYMKKAGTRFNENIVYSNGTALNDPNSDDVKVDHYFLVMPMTWTVLNEKDGKATIMSDDLIDSKAFLDSKNNNDPYGPFDKFNIKESAGGVDNKDVYANNYEHSDIRSFLNGGFYESAFTSAQQAIMTSVSNENNTGVFEDNRYSKANGATEDKIYLLTYDDLFNADLGFYTHEDYKDKEIGLDPLKTAITTDFARANGAFTQTIQSSFGGAGYWWTRSSGKHSDSVTVLMGADAYVSSQGINSYNENVGVRPVITIKL